MHRLSQQVLRILAGFPPSALQARKAAADVLVQVLQRDMRPLGEHAVHAATRLAAQQVEVSEAVDDAVARIVAAGRQDRFLHLQGRTNRVDLYAPPAEPTRNNLFVDGMLHVFGGYDHLLYIGLLFLCLRGRWRELLLGVTCFTLAHSLTLGLSAFGRLQVPTRPVEAVIGLTIAYFAITLLSGRDRILGWRLYAAILLCGLIHGLGFANSLADLELGRSNLLWGLASFNLGIECAQILCLLTAAAMLALGRSLGGITRALRLEHACVTLAGAVGAFWYFQRLFA